MNTLGLMLFVILNDVISTQTNRNPSTETTRSHKSYRMSGAFLDLFLEKTFMRKIGQKYLQCALLRLQPETLRLHCVTLTILHRSSFSLRSLWRKPLSYCEEVSGLILGQLRVLLRRRCTISPSALNSWII